MSLHDLDYYTLLGVEDDADERTIKASFRKFARRYHPDRYAGASDEKIERATAIYRRGSEAYTALTDPRTRSLYDEKLREGHLRLTAEDIERATKPVVEAPAKKKPAVPIRSPQALQYYKQGIAAAHAGKWQRSWQLLGLAHEAEPDNEFISDRYYRVEKKLRRGR